MTTFTPRNLRKSVHIYFLQNYRLWLVCFSLKSSEDNHGLKHLFLYFGFWVELTLLLLSSFFKYACKLTFIYIWSWILFINIHYLLSIQGICRYYLLCILFWENHRLSSINDINWEDGWNAGSVTWWYTKYPFIRFTTRPLVIWKQWRATGRRRQRNWYHQQCFWTWY